MLGNVSEPGGRAWAQRRSARRRLVIAGGLAVLVLLSGCTDFVTLGRQGQPVGDPLGWEDGHWYDDDLAVTPDDGLDESERRAVVARAMARVERIRGLEFETRVPVTVISRAEYRKQFDDPDRRGGEDSATFEAWNNQVWEALVLVGEGTNVSAAFDAVYGATVQGFYAPGRDEIVVVSDSETPTIDPGTLAHELVHAVHDQRPHPLRAGARTQDQQLASNGLSEGDANTVQAAYESRCGRAWDCLPRPERSPADRPPSFDRGVFTAIFAPYAEGPGFVEALRERGGWTAVNDAYRQMPESTEQVIHPARYPDETPENVTVPDRSSRAWNRFDLDMHADTVGEASIYAMFRANGRITRAPRFDYSHPLSAGWGGDTVVPYRNGSSYGYVWKTVWDTPADAGEFLEGYRGVLDAHNAKEVEDGVYVVPESDPFGDAFRVSRRGDTVLVVNAPTRADLADVHSVS